MTILSAVAIGVVMHTLAATSGNASPPLPLLEAARAFVASLDAGQREKAVLPFNSEARFDWHYVPRDRPGLALKEMRPEQQAKALDLVRAALSPKGFETTETIRKLDQVLRDMGG